MCRSGSLPEFLDEYKFFPGLAVHWILFGPSGRETRPQAGGVLEHYKRCRPTPSGHIKIIANTFYVSDVTAHPHNMHFRCSLTVSACLQQPFWGLHTSMYAI